MTASTGARTAVRRGRRAGSPLGAVVRAILIEPARVLAGTDAGLFASGDGGADVDGRSPAACLPRPSTRWSSDAPSASVLAGTAAGVFASGDGGQTWTSTGGPANPNVLSLAVLSDGTVLAGTKGGSVFRDRSAPPERTAAPSLVLPRRPRRGRSRRAADRLH